MADDDVVGADPVELDPQVKGGLARAEALTPEVRSEIAQKAADARWGITSATHEGPLQIGGIQIPCAVLEDGTRVLSRIGFIRAIGRKGKAKGGRKYDQESQVPVFLTAENLKPFITKEVTENYNPVRFRTLTGGVAIGYRADLLPHVCNVFMDAKEAGALRDNQLHIAEHCKILSRGFSTVGLTALIDEATGYQEVRDRLALQAILDKYIAKAFAAWAKKFPDEFYQQIFRLNGWQWMGMKKNRPWAVARYTDDLVYRRLAPGVLKELRECNPRDERGHRKAKHHQWLTVDVGHTALAQHLYGIIGLMRTCDDNGWKDFMVRVERAYPRQDNLGQLRLFNDQETA